jgi:hypothetical protein
MPACVAMCGSSNDLEVTKRKVDLKADFAGRKRSRPVASPTKAADLRIAVVPAGFEPATFRV